MSQFNRRNFNNSSNNNSNNSSSDSDLYQELIANNDLVKELDDIEAISQQISEHAEVLYQNWKSHSSPQNSPSVDTRSKQEQQLYPRRQFPHRATTTTITSPTNTSSSSTLTTGPGSTKLTKENGLENSYNNNSSNTLMTPTRLHHHQQQNSFSDLGVGNSSTYSSSPYQSATLPLISRNSTNITNTPVGGNNRSVKRTLSSGSEIKSEEVEPLELLASPEVNGNLKDLVNSFVSTDRAKQAARQTISDTISNMTRRSNGGSSNSSTTSSFSSRGMSPLKSPMLAAGGGSMSGGPLSPSASSTISSLSSDSQRSLSALTLRSPFDDHHSQQPFFPSNSDIHSQMRPMFGSNYNSQGSSGGGGGGVSKTRELKIDIGKANSTQTISIPVQHMGRSSISPSSQPKEISLQSPKVIQNINTMPISRSNRNNPNRNSLEFDMPLPNLHAANVERMRQRFDEAKQRINLMHQRAMEFPSFAAFNNDIDTVDMRPRFIDSEDSSILLEQLRRRSARRRDPPAAPHPELTPQQKQHIIERSTVTPSNMNYNAQGFPLRRFMSAGSVADRVMIFERCPTVFGPEKESRTIPLSILEKRTEPSTSPPTSTTIKLATPNPPSSGAATSTPPWRNKSQEITLQPAVSQHASAVRDRLLNKSTAALNSSKPTPIITATTTPTPSPSPSAPSPVTRVNNHKPEAPILTTAKFIQEPKPSTPIFPSNSISPPVTSSKLSSQSRDPILVENSKNSSVVQPNRFQKTTSLRLVSPNLSSSISNNNNNNNINNIKRPVAAEIKRKVIGVAASEKNLPRFYFPLGNPAQRPDGIEGSIRQLREAARKLKKSSLNQKELGEVLKICGHHLYWRSLVFNLMTGDKRQEKVAPSSISVEQLAHLWRRMCERNHDTASQMIYLLTKGARKSVVPEDFVTLVQDIVESHPGLGFLKEATEFHSRYVHTVIARIFFCVNRSWSGRITIAEMRKSNFLQILKVIEDEEDINQITQFFSYEHFYVIYCKFWELDKDHDLFIDREDLSRHNDHAISTRMIDRIFSGAVTRGSAQREGKMSYTEFVWFLLAEEDKRHPTSIEYWFRCMDLDGDGFLSMYELEYFYEEQLQRMEQLGIETLPYEDCLCQMLDMLMPNERTRISLKDLKRCPMTPIFFDTFFNLEKYLDHEQRDPFASQREVDEDGNEMSDWDRFAAEEYELLVAEEGNAEELDSLSYEDELENAEMQLGENLDDSKLSERELLPQVEPMITT